MHSHSQVHRSGAIALVLAMTAAMAGCETTSDWLMGRRTVETTPVALDQPRADDYLTELYEFTSGDPATQAEIFADAESAATITPNPSTKLRYALVLAAPGHAETDNGTAQSIFRDVLAQTELLTPSEIAIANIHLRDVEERLVLDAEARQLRSENSRAAATEAAAVSQRIANIEAENRRLRQSLADAEAKLEALSAIERSIREQSKNNDTQ